PGPASLGIAGNSRRLRRMNFIVSSVLPSRNCVEATAGRSKKGEAGIRIDLNGARTARPAVHPCNGDRLLVLADQPGKIYVHFLVNSVVPGIQVRHNGYGEFLPTQQNVDTSHQPLE